MSNKILNYFFITIFFIIIIIITIYIFKFYVNNNNINSNISLKESFVFDAKNNIPNFVKNYLDIDFKKNPNYRYENITEYNFNRLFKKLELVNKEKIIFKDKSNYNFYTQSTTEDKLRLDLDMITKYVLLILNNDKYYDFSKTNYGDVEMWIDKKGNEEIKYELFVWDKKNYFQLKLLIHIIKFVEEGQVAKYGIKETPYMFPNYNIGLPFKDQLIPLPNQVIITGHFDTGNESIKPNNPPPIKSLYINQIEIQNSTLIVDFHKNKYPFNRLTVDENGFSGTTDSSLEYSIMKGKMDHNPYLSNGSEYNKWIRLDEEPSYISEYPAKFPPIKKWDNLGIYYYDNEPIDQQFSKEPPKNSDEIVFTKEDKIKEDRYCNSFEKGTRWSEERQPLEPNFWPSNYTVFSNCGQNYWLFDLATPPPGNNTFIGGGKR
jgi:hypothetical protein